MGASFNSRTYDGELSKKEVEKLWSNAVEESLYESGHSYSGEIGMLGNNIKWTTKEFQNENDADEYISKTHQKWEKAIAVGYTNPEGKKIWLVGGWCSS